MNRKVSFSLLIILVFFLCFTRLNAQNSQKKEQPLTSILKVLEKRFNVKFSYADLTVKDKTAVAPSNNLTLVEVIDFLKEKTLLNFQILDNRFIAIRARNNSRGSDFSTQQLEEIVLTNYLTSGISKTKTGSITIKPSNFGILPGLIEPDVLQTVQALPGIISVDETVSNINVRGGTHDQNLILWDGIKMYQSGHFFGLISAFNPYLTKSVNISKNGTSARYGDGISSIIDMQLSNDIENTFKGGVGFNMINLDGFAKIPLKENMTLQVSSRRSVTDFILTPTYDQYFKRIFQDSDLTKQNTNASISQNEKFFFYDIATKLLIDITKKDKIRLNILNIFNQLNYEEQSRINNVDEVLNSLLKQHNLSGGITYTRDWNKAFSTSAQFYISNYDLDATNFDVINNQRLIQENEVYDGALKIDALLKLSDRLKIGSGYHFSEVGISNLEDINNPVFRKFIKDVIRTHSFYTEADWTSKSYSTYFKGGIRLNYIEKLNEFLVEPRLSFSHRFANYFRFELLGELKSQTTSQVIDLQNDFLGIEKRRWILSNNEDEVDGFLGETHIPVIKSKQASAGFHFNKNNWLISAEAFVKKIDGITTRSQGFQNQFQFVNAIGSYTVSGIDILFNKQFDRVSTWLSYSFSDNNYTFDDLNNGKSFPNNFDIEQAVTFAGTYTNNKLKVALGLNWHSGKPVTNPVANNNIIDNTVNYESPNSSNLEDYFRVDASATYTFNFSNTTKAFIGASVWNVLDRNNIINRYYTIDNEGVVSTVNNESLGITPNLSLRVHF